MPLRIALFGQAPLAVDVLDGLVSKGHEIVGVYAPPDRGRPDPLVEAAQRLGLVAFRRRYFRTRGGEAIQAALDSYRGLGADLNVLASMTSFLPREITDAPVHRSLCFHPSLLPRFRGGSALQWQIIEGEKDVGVTIFVPDEGADTGPIAVQRDGISVAPDETAGSLFFDKLYPLGVEAMLEAVRRVDQGQCLLSVQDETRATHQGLADDSVAGIDLSQPAERIDRQVRGCDPQPGAWLRFRGDVVRLYDARLEAAEQAPPGTVIAIGADGLRLGLAGGTLRVGRLRADSGKQAAGEFAARVGLRPGDSFESA